MPLYRAIYRRLRRDRSIMTIPVSAAKAHPAHSSVWVGSPVLGTWSGTGVGVGTGSGEGLGVSSGVGTGDGSCVASGAGSTEASGVSVGRVSGVAEGSGATVGVGMGDGVGVGAGFGGNIGSAVGVGVGFGVGGGSSSSSSSSSGIGVGDGTGGLDGSAFFSQWAVKLRAPVEPWGMEAASFWACSSSAAVHPLKIYPSLVGSLSVMVSLSMV